MKSHRVVCAAAAGLASHRCGGLAGGVFAGQWQRCVCESVMWFGFMTFAARGTIAPRVSQGRSFAQVGEVADLHRAVRKAGDDIQLSTHGLDVAAQG